MKLFIFFNRKIFLVIALLTLLVFPLSTVAVKKVIPKNTSSLQPIPQNVIPDVSHNINSTHDQSPLYVNNQPDGNSPQVSDQKDQHTPDKFLPTNITAIKNGNGIVYLTLCIVFVVAVLIFFLFLR